MWSGFSREFKSPARISGSSKATIAGLCKWLKTTPMTLGLLIGEALRSLVCAPMHAVLFHPPGGQPALRTPVEAALPRSPVHRSGLPSPC